MKNRFAQRLTALALLLAYLAVGTALIPGAVAMAADLEGSHELSVIEQEGSYQIMLHHRANDFTPAACDHHTGLARALTRFCTSTRSADHRFSATVVVSVSRGPSSLAFCKASASVGPLVLMSGFWNAVLLESCAARTPSQLLRPPRLRSVHEALTKVQMLI